MLKISQINVIKLEITGDSMVEFIPERKGEEREASIRSLKFCWNI